ncbi:MAG: GNAT family N-acetyltransferase [Bacteroidota bacterium]
MKSYRLIYNKFTEDQYADYIRWYTHEGVMKFIGGRPLTLEETRKRFENALLVNQEHEEMGLYAVRSPETNDFLGIAKFILLKPGQAEVGYGFLPEFWGNGYATEVLRFLIDHANRLDEINELVGIVDRDNKISQRVLTNQGFQYGEVVESDGQSTLYYYLSLAK